MKSKRTKETLTCSECWVWERFSCGFGRLSQPRGLGGWDNFLAEAEADAAQGLKFPHALRGYRVYVMPAITLVIFAFGYYEKFFK